MKTTGGDFFGRHYFREEDGIHMKGLKELAMQVKSSIPFIRNKVKEIDKNAKWLSGPISLLGALYNEKCQICLHPITMSHIRMDAIGGSL